MSNTKAVNGTIFNIQRFSLHDGPGIRTTVFFKGCNMRCAWCHNPESFTTVPQISIDYNKCNSCGCCVSVCPNSVHRIDANLIHHYSKELCNACGTCIDNCPKSAISMIGKIYTAEQVMEEVMKDRIYYERSGGGVTFSGGEATVQYDFLLQLLQISKAQNLHTCLETNGLVSTEHLAQISQHVDLFLFDYKHYDDNQHQKYTGVSNQLILKNLDYLNTQEKDIILRCPIIPGINDVPAHFEAIKALKDRYPFIRQAELMPYHDIGVSKWKNIGYTYELGDIKPPKKDRIEEWNRLIQ